jgi:YD repeat-containing protein
VLSTDNEPIVGATASLDGRTAMTDAAGAFLLTGVTAGTDRPLMVDGRTANSPNKTYPVIIEPANIVAGQANVNPYTFYLPPIDTQYEVEVVPGQNTVASNPRVPGLEMTIPMGANLRNRDGSPVARVSITPLAIDRTPAPLPSNVATGLVYTSQPGGAIADIPMPVIYPNLLGTNPGTQVDLYAFNHDTVQWYVYGTGTVSSDGRTIVPDINPSTGNRYGLPDFSWHFPSFPNAGQGGNPGGRGGCGGQGPRPVNYSTGIKSETTTDIIFGGARGGLALIRYYTSDNSALNFNGRFGRGVHDNFDVTLTGSWAVGGSGRVIMPDEQTGRLFNYVRTENDGTRVFTTTSTLSQLGDVVRRLIDGTFEYRYLDGSMMRFDSGGRMSALIDRNGNTTTLTYTGSRLTSITDPVGRSITLAYNASGLVSTATNPIGKVWSYTYGTFGFASGFLATVTDPLGNTTNYSYTNARLTSVTDSRGNVVKTITYDSNGRVIKQQFADGGFETYE